MRLPQWDSPTTAPDGSHFRAGSVGLSYHGSRNGNDVSYHGSRNGNDVSYHGSRNNVAPNCFGVGLSYYGSHM